MCRDRVVLDAPAKLAMIDVPSRQGDSAGSTVIQLGDLPSPLAERCDRAGINSIGK